MSYDKKRKTDRGRAIAEWDEGGDLGNALAREKRRLSNVDVNFQETFQGSERDLDHMHRSQILSERQNPNKYPGSGTK